jgi:phosphinothricin acetyltransferase
MNVTPFIRSATEIDAAALLAIYRPYVERTAVSFETAVPTVEEFAGRITTAVAGWAWLVAEAEGECVGYAYAAPHRKRPAYRWSVETSVYVRDDYQRRGIARALYAELFKVLIGKGFCNALAAVTLPNPASVALHQSVGFLPIGVFKAVGRKFGVWHDVAWYQRALRDTPPAE